MEVYQKVAHYIAENGLDVAWIARKAMIPQAELCAILEGRKTMDVVDLRDLCLALNVSPEFFIDPSEKGTICHE